MNALNQYTNIHNGVTNTPSYDPDGNMLTHAGWTYSWNGENRLTQASNDTTVITYAYDYMGRRFSKTQVSGLSTQTFCYVYDGWNLIQEVTCNSVTPGTSVTNSYVWGLDLSGTLQGAGGIGGLLSVVHGPLSVAYYATYDANGNVTDYLDETGTNIVAHYEYGPFGGTISATGDKKDDFRFRFSTKYLDDELGWYYYGFRYYSPELGRWLSRDPIGERGGLLLYGFVRNNTVNKRDPLGRATNDPGEFGWDIYDPDFGVTNPSSPSPPGAGGGSSGSIFPPGLTGAVGGGGTACVPIPALPILSVCASFNVSASGKKCCDVQGGGQKTEVDVDVTVSVFIGVSGSVGGGISFQSPPYAGPVVGYSGAACSTEGWHLGVGGYISGGYQSWTVGCSVTIGGSGVSYICGFGVGSGTSAGITGSGGYTFLQ